MVAVTAARGHEQMGQLLQDDPPRPYTLAYPGDRSQSPFDEVGRGLLGSGLDPGPG